MKKDKPFLVEEHEQFAAELYRMRLIAMRYTIRISRACSKASRQARQATKLQGVIDSLRSEMDNQFYREYPQKEFRHPYKPWVHTPYYNPQVEKRLCNLILGEQDELQ